MNLYNLSSLTPQAVLSEKLFGKNGPIVLKRWLHEQVLRTDDPDFARLFSDHIALPGVAQADYNHRLITTGAGKFLGGIRFYRQDITRPFVEIVAHDFVDIGVLCEAVAREWKSFSPRSLRLLTAPAHRPVAHAWLDMSIHVGRCDRMPQPDGRVSLAPFESAEDAIVMVTNRYQDVMRANPDLGRNISPAAAEDLAEWHDSGGLCAVLADMSGVSERVGVFAVRRGAVEWITGDEVAEEVIRTAFIGRGFAAQAQMVWAATQRSKPDCLLIGTIDRLNVASRRTAEKAGRSAVLEYVFVPLDHPSE